MKPRPRVRLASSMAAIDPAAPRDVRDAARSALQAIDAVHRVGGALFPESFPVDDRVPDGCGAGVYRGSTDKSIGLRSGVPAGAHTFLHEFAHLIDDHRLAIPQSPDAMDGSLLADWWKAVDATSRILAIKTCFILEDDMGEVAYLEYLLRPREVWARAYAQWIAAESGVAEVQEAFLTSTALDDEYNAHWWGEDDFAPVAAAIRALFGRIGWLER